MPARTKLYASLTALVGCSLAPASALASNSGLLRSFFREFPNLLPFFLCLVGLMLLYGAYSNDDDIFDSSGARFMEKIVGRTGTRVAFVVIGLGVLGAGLPSFSISSSQSTEQMRLECGDPGTQSYINDEGFCDCPSGFTWADESDETSVVCMAESYAPRGT